MYFSECCFTQIFYAFVNVEEALVLLTNIKKVLKICRVVKWLTYYKSAEKSIEEMVG